MSYPLFLTVTTVTVTSSLFSLFPYQALQCPEQFVGHIGGIVFEVKDLVFRYRTEVRVVGAVAASRDGDVHNRVGSVVYTAPLNYDWGELSYNGFLYVVGVHTHIGKCSYHQGVATDQVVHLVILTYYLAAVDVFVTYWFEMPTFRKSPQCDNTGFDFCNKGITCPDSEFVVQIITDTLKLQPCSF